MKKKFGFTLAEVLITITIIGVVAALTIPNLLSDVNQRKYNAASGNFQRKLGEALKIMSAQNTLKGHKTTLSFVNELGKNFKILKVCTTVTDCFPSEFKKSNDGIIDVSTLTDSTTLGRTYNTQTVGVQFADGIRAIVAYNPNYKLQSNGDVVSFDKDDTNKTVSMRTNVFSMIFDVSEDDNNKIGEDIFLMNANFEGEGPCVQIGTYCVKDFKTDYVAIPCADGLNPDYCGTNPSGVAQDYLAGAKRKCELEEMKLPTLPQLSDIYVYTTTDEYKELLSLSDWYWSSSSSMCNNKLNFSDANTYNCNNHHANVLCIAN